MQAHRPAVDERRDDVALHQVEDDGVDEHDHDLGRCPVRHGDEEGQAGGHEPADVRDEAGNERQDGDRHREGQAKKQHDQELGDGSNRRDGSGAQHVATQDLGGVDASLVQQLPPPRRGARDHQRPTARRVAQHVEGEDRRQDQDEREGADQVDHRAYGPHDLHANIGSEADQCLEVALGRRVRLLRAVDGRLDALDDRAGELEDGEDDHKEKQQECAARHSRGGPAGAPTTPLQVAGQRRDAGGDHRRDDDRDDDQRHLSDQKDQDAHDADDRQRPPAPLGDPIEPSGHHAAVVALGRLQQFQHRPADGDNEGDDRQGRKEADHAGHVTRDGERDQDHGRMQVDGMAVDDRAQELVLEHGGDAQQHEQDDRGSASQPSPAR